MKINKISKNLKSTQPFWKGMNFTKFQNSYKAFAYIIASLKEKLLWCFKNKTVISWINLHSHQRFTHETRFPQSNGSQSCFLCISSTLSRASCVPPSFLNGIGLTSMLMIKNSHHHGEQRGIHKWRWNEQCPTEYWRENKTEICCFKELVFHVWIVGVIVDLFRI